MSNPTTIGVAHYIAAGDQTLGCGHRIARGDRLTDLTFGAPDDLSARVLALCDDCWAALGRLGNER
jgi:hypothetical protein